MKGYFTLFILCSILLGLYGVTAVKSQLYVMQKRIAEQKAFLEKFESQNRFYQNRINSELARDVAVGKDGSYWIIGSEIGGTGGYEIFKWDATNGKWTPIAGSGVRISVGPDGKPWIVDKFGHILKYTGTNWVQLSGTGNDIGLGADGTVWHVGVDGSLHKLNSDGTTWQDIDGEAIRIAVDPTGKPWIVNDKKEIYRYTGSGWQQIPGEAVDVGIGADGTVIISGGERTDAGYQTLKWDADNNQWTVIAGISSANVAVTPNGDALAADSDLVIEKSGTDTTSTQTTTQTGTTGGTDTGTTSQTTQTSGTNADGSVTRTTTTTTRTITSSTPTTTSTTTTTPAL